MTRPTWNWILLSTLSGALLVYLLGNDAVGLIDRDEPRYAQTSRQMLQSGDWVVPRFLDTIRTAKPVLIYWCQAAGMSVFGDNAFAARFPSSAAMVITLAILAICITREAGANRGLWTIFIFGTAGLTLASAKMCLTDSVLLLWIVIGQLCIYRLWRYGVHAPTILLLGLAIGLSGLTKGPVALGVHGCTIIALWLMGRSVLRNENDVIRGTQYAPAPNASPLNLARDFALIVPIVLAVVFVVVFPWLWMIRMRAPEFLSTTIGHDVVARIQRGQEGHRGPPGLYSLMVWGTYFPWSFLLPAVIVTAWRNRHLPTTRFALAAWIGPWVMFELIAGKLPHYVLPTYPALAYLTADLLIRAARRSIPDLHTRAAKIGATVWGLIVVALGVVPYTALFIAGLDPSPSVTVVSLLMALVAIVTAVTVVRRFHVGRILAGARAMGGGMAAMVVLLWAGYLPRFEPIRLSQNVADVITSRGGYGQAGLMIDYKEPSLAFHQGGGLREESERGYLNVSDPLNWPNWVVLTREVLDELVPDRRAMWEEVGSVQGIAYSDRGRKVEVVVLRRR